MAELGLSASKYAATSFCENTQRFRQDYWVCPSCTMSNHPLRLQCIQCSAETILKQSGLGASAYSPQNVNSAAWKTTHDVANGVRDTQVLAQQHSEEQLRNTSNHQHEDPAHLETRWQPLRSTGGAETVWTRTTTLTETYPSHIPSNYQAQASLDLGLPYEVQHYILTMMQRILEEGCYEFAHRNIPKLLVENNWTCPELVELSKWKEVLPIVIPPGSIAQDSSYTLERGLLDAVRIRNAATHRHLCNNTEIKKMAEQAQGLMSMFGDVSRQNRFLRLSDELSEWDHAVLDPDTKRQKLELVLREISERPVDDMDWTPNSVSLQEVTPVKHVRLDSDEIMGGME